MQQPSIRYDLLVQDALRSMVRDLLTKVAREGLPGEHHFFVTFKTNAPGVQLSSRMKAQYPDEITIVLQHQFWDLIVSDRQFEVGLSFGNVPERLVVPFSAVTGFHDPSVPFMLKFEPKETKADVDDEAPAAPAGATPLARPKLAERKTFPAPVAARDTAQDAGAKGEAEDGSSDESPDEGATKVVSIDAFRKKT